MATLTLTEETSTNDGIDRIDFVTQLPSSVDEISHASADETNAGLEVRRPESQFEEQPTEEYEYPTGAKLWLSVVTICGVLILSALDINIVAVAVPSITNEFHTVADVGWYSSAFRLTTCAFQFMFGKIYKLFPVKPVFMISNAIFLVSSVMCAAADSSLAFIVGRAVSGLAFAGILSGINAVNIFPPHRRPAFIGFILGIESVAIAASPIIGGALIEVRGWRWCFWINLPIAGATLVMTFFFLPNLRDGMDLPLKQKLYEMDLFSNLLFIPAMTSLFIALSWGEVKYSWQDGRIIGLFITFVVLLIAFLWNQHRRGDSAALPIHILKNRNIVAGFIFSTCVNSVLNVLSYYLPTYYQIVRQYTPAHSGYMMIPIVVGDSIGAMLHGSGTSIFGYYTPFMLVASMGMPIFSGLVTTFNPATSLVKLILYTGAAGFSTGLGFMGPQSAARTVLKAEDTQLGMSIILFGGNFGPAVSIAIAQVIFTNSLSTILKQSGLISEIADIENRGLGAIVNSVPPSKRGEVVVKISKSLSQTWYLAVGLGSAAMVGSLLMEWRSVKQKKS